MLGQHVQAQGSLAECDALSGILAGNAPACSPFQPCHSLQESWVRKMFPAVVCKTKSHLTLVALSGGVACVWLVASVSSRPSCQLPVPLTWILTLGMGGISRKTTFFCRKRISCLPTPFSFLFKAPGIAKWHVLNTPQPTSS